jgi:hypothetical protein
MNISKMADQRKMGSLSRPLQHLALIAAMTVHPSALYSADQLKSGWVLDIAGTWVLEGQSSPLSRAQTLPVGGVLVNPSPHDDDYITVANMRGEVFKIIRCKDNVCRQCVKGGGCYDPIQPLPQGPDEGGPFFTVLQGMIQLFFGQPDRYSIHRARSAAFDLATESVLKLEGKKLDLGQFMRERMSGTFSFEFDPLDSKMKLDANSQPTTVTIEWNPDNPKSAIVLGVRPGLYRVIDGTNKRPGSAWVLVCEAANYDSTAATYESFLKSTESWGGEIDHDAKISYQRAFLDYLSRSHSQRTDK